MRTPLIYLIISAFIFNTLGPLPAKADGLYLPVPGVMVHLSPPENPPVLKGVTIYPDNPFKFDFILDKGDEYSHHPDENIRHPERSEGSQQEQLKIVSAKLVKYFLASITTPENDLWVNLSPYEKNRIIPESFGQTGMGRDLLAEDYILKQITASLVYPEEALGKQFWKRIYEEAARKFGTTNIPVNTFNKVWIVPDHAKVYEHGNTAFVVKAKLKVMLEQDYLALQKHASVRNDMASVGANIVREIVIPELTKEVNEGQNFATLRQVYYSLILAVWFKKRMKDSILGRKYMDQNKISNLSSPNASVGDPGTIYQRYLKAFKKGVYNYIKEEADPVTQEMVPRKYFSGGFVGDFAMHSFEETREILPEDIPDSARVTGVEINLADGVPDQAMNTDETIKRISDIVDKLPPMERKARVTVPNTSWRILPDKQLAGDNYLDELLSGDRFGVILEKNGISFVVVPQKNLMFLSGEYGQEEIWGKRYVFLKKGRNNGVIIPDQMPFDGPAFMMNEKMRPHWKELFNRLIQNNTIEYGASVRSNMDTRSGETITLPASDGFVQEWQEGDEGSFTSRNPFGRISSIHSHTDKGVMKLFPSPGDLRSLQGSQKRSIIAALSQDRKKMYLAYFDTGSMPYKFVYREDNKADVYKNGAFIATTESDASWGPVLRPMILSDVMPNYMRIFTIDYSIDQGGIIEGEHNFNQLLAQESGPHEGPIDMAALVRPSPDKVRAKLREIEEDLWRKIGRKDRYDQSKFESLKEIGRGSRGTVYVDPYDPDPKRFYKVYDIRGMNELKILTYLNLNNVPGVPKVMDYGITMDGRIWISLEGVVDAKSIVYWNDGLGMHKKSEVWEKFSFQQQLDKVASFAEILESAHQVGISHNDVTPRNILVGADKVSVMVIDWDNATAFEDEQLEGTPGFEAPEAIKQDQSDVYGLECSMEEVLQGYFSNRISRMMRIKLFKSSPILERVKTDLKNLQKLMHDRDPDRRPTMEEVARELRKFAVVFRLEEIKSGLEIELPQRKQFRNTEFDLYRREGAGGIGTVYDNPDDPKSFYKVYRKGAMNELINLKFLNEKNMAGIPRVMDYGTMPNGRIWVLMEEIENARSIQIRGTWDFLISKLWGRLTFSQKLQKMAKVADILEAAHRTGVGHGDINPRNILINDQDEDDVRVIDWDMARAFGLRPVGWTDGFKPPEEVILDKSDVFSLGYTLLKSFVPEIEQETQTALKLKSLYESMVLPSADDRPTIEEVAGTLKALAIEASQESGEGNAAMSTELIRVKDAEEGQRVLNKVEIHGHTSDERKKLIFALDRTDIRRLGMQPKYKVEAGGRTIYFSTPYHVGENSTAILGYVEDNGVFIGRTYYMSGSQAVWRYLPRVRLGAKEKIVWYGKGYSEDSIPLPYQLQKVLAEMLGQEEQLTLQDEDQVKLFAGTTNTESRTYVGVMDPVPEKIMFKDNPKAEGLYEHPEQLDFSDPGDKPNLDLDRMMDTYTFQSPVYGSLTARVFRSSNNKYIFTFMRDDKGRSWIANIETNGSLVLNALGLKSKWVNGWPFVVPAFEYEEQASTFGNYGLVYKSAGNEILYVDMWKNYLSKVPVIQEFHRKYPPPGGVPAAKREAKEILPFEREVVRNWNGQDPVTLRIGNTLVQVRKDDEGYFGVLIDKNGIDTSTKVHFKDYLDLGRESSSETRRFKMKNILMDHIDPKVSKRHAIVNILDGQMTIFDLGSKHGTFYVIGALTPDIVKDLAMISQAGGIDLTAKRMKLDIDSDKAAVSKPMDVKVLENIEINGLYIKDIEIKPLKNLPELLGVSSH